MSDLTQLLIVGVAVFVAAVFVVRRVIAAFRPSARPPGCESCAVADLADRGGASEASPSGRRA